MRFRSDVRTRGWPQLELFTGRAKTVLLAQVLLVQVLLAQIRRTG
jgi:hypothetical protein